jgi:bifunctional non-homologous end joining protein LigD
LRKTLDKLEQDRAPFANPPRGYEAKGAHWVQPKLVGEVSFTEWTQDGTLRHPSFQGLREDKKASEVVRERPVNGADAGVPDSPARAKPRASRQALRDDASASQVAGITLSHPDKLMYPEAKLTKRDLARYYEEIGDRAASGGPPFEPGALPRWMGGPVLLSETRKQGGARFG